MVNEIFRCHTSGHINESMEASDSLLSINIILTSIVFYLVDDHFRTSSLSNLYGNIASQGRIASDSLSSNNNQNENSRIREQLGDKAFSYNW